MQHFVIKCCILTFTNNIGIWENYFIGKLKFFNLVCLASIAKVNSGRSIPKAEVTLANSQTEVTLANFYISVLFHAIV